MAEPPGILIGGQDVESLSEYRAAGGGRGWERAQHIGPDAVIAEIRASRLRGRGGAGFPTGVKWAGLRADEAARKFVVCNAAEGEPGTYKDRRLITHNPYQLVEGLSIAAFAVGAERAFIGIKGKFEAEIRRLEQAARELEEAGMVGVPIDLVAGPDDYLFGEEKAMLEVIEGKDPLPRLNPPYVQGLFETTSGAKQPALVNNVETLCNVPHIVARGASWFRTFGTADTPGTMVFTISGDVRTEAVVELEMGTPLSALVYLFGGGFEAGRHPKLAVSGVSNAPLPASRLETPMDFGSMEAAGSGLGSGGFVVYDDSVCVVQVASALSAFLFRGSCGQCPPCKLGTEALTVAFTRLALGGAGEAVLDDIAAWLIRVTDANRCGLGAGQRAFAAGVLRDFAADVAHHLDGSGCSSSRTVMAPAIASLDVRAGRFRLVEPDPHAA